MDGHNIGVRIRENDIFKSAVLRNNALGREYDTS